MSAILRFLIPYLVSMAVTSPLLLYYREKEESWKFIPLFFAFGFVHTCLLVLPLGFESLDLIGGSWNWTGKLFSILGSILFYYLFRGGFSENDFLNIGQKKGSLRYTLTGAALLVAPSVMVAFFFSGELSMNLETLGFQLTMPGIDEEIAYRGVLLGLLASSLYGEMKFGRLNLKHPGIWVTSILFGLAHGLRFSGVIQMDWFSFSMTFAVGFILAWITLKGRSILVPIVAHNLLNFSVQLTRMLK